MRVIHVKHRHVLTSKDVDRDAKGQEQETCEQGSFHQQNVPSVRSEVGQPCWILTSIAAETLSSSVLSSPRTFVRALTYRLVLRNQ